METKTQDQPANVAPEDNLPNQLPPLMSVPSIELLGKYELIAALQEIATYGGTEQWDGRDIVEYDGWWAGYRARQALKIPEQDLPNGKLTDDAERRSV